ncbi:MAG: hypothetical protein HC802_16745 [Caldilineaceae bacterium]|nr:hypothetical protein [Caldilineaceae bacterium]
MTRRRRFLSALGSVLFALLSICGWLALDVRPASAQDISITQPCFNTVLPLHGQEASGSDITGEPVLNRDGDIVAYWSTSNLSDEEAAKYDGNIEVFRQSLLSNNLPVQISQSKGSILGGFNLGPSSNYSGTHIVFYSDRDLIAEENGENGQNPDANFEIYLAVFDASGQFQQLYQITKTTKSANFNPVISGDGRRIAFTSDDATLGQTPTRDNSDGSTELFIADLDQNFNPTFRQVTDNIGQIFNDQPAISGDGQYVAYVTGNSSESQVVIWNSVNDSKFQVTRTGPNIANTQPSLNRDGSRLAYVSTRTGYSAVFLYDAITGLDSQISIASQNSTAGEPSISADGQRVVFTSVEEDGTRIVLWDKRLPPVCRPLRLAKAPRATMAGQR